MFNDKSGDGSLTNMSAMASVAYHQKLASDDHYLSIGFQAGYVQKKVDESKLIFENMIDGNGGVTQPSGETFIDEKFNYFDFNAGFHWSSTFTDRFHAYAGFGYFHIGEPVETFLGDQSNVLNARYMAHGGVKVGFSDKIVLLPAVQWQMQGEGSVSELMAGASLGSVSYTHLRAHETR